MAQERKKNGALARAFNRVKDAYKRVHDAVDNRVVQWRHGKHDDNRAKILERLVTLPGGKELLAMAEEHRVDISVVAAGAIDGSKGRFSRRRESRTVRVSNNGDIDLMTTTLWHELRHVEQHISRGDMRGGGSRLVDTRLQHTFSLMHEADAFTQQFLLGVRQQAAGHPEYLDKLLARSGGASVVARGVLRGKDAKKYDNEEQMARALFTEIMLRGLTIYNAKYMEAYHDSFKGAETLQEYRKLVGRKKAHGLPDDEKLTAVYGLKYMASTSLQAIATAFLHAQPPEVYDALLLVEKTAANAATMTEKEYTAARKDIMTRTKSLSKAFNKAALKYPQEPRKKLREAALSSRPPDAGKGMGVRAA